MIPETDPTLTIVPLASRKAGTAARLRYHGHQIHSQDPLPQLIICAPDVMKRDTPRRARVVDDDVEASELLDRCCNEPLRVLLTGDVGLHVYGLGEGARERLARFNRARRVNDQTRATRANRSATARP